MKINVAFLLLGIMLSIISKVFQYTNKEKIGNIIVMPAASLLVLAIIFTLPKVQAALDKVNGLKHIVILSVWACIGVFSFQVMMMILVGNGNKLALLLILPIVVAAVMVFYKWRVL